MIEYVQGPDHPVRRLTPRMRRPRPAPRSAPIPGDFQVHFDMPHPSPAELLANHTEAFLGMARVGDEQGFRDLAACFCPALTAREVDEFWVGTVARVHGGLHEERTVQVQRADGTTVVHHGATPTFTQGSEEVLLVRLYGTRGDSHEYTVLWNEPVRVRVTVVDAHPAYRCVEAHLIVLVGPLVLRTIMYSMPTAFGGRFGAEGALPCRECPIEIMAGDTVTVTLPEVLINVYER